MAIRNRILAPVVILLVSLSSLVLRSQEPKIKPTAHYAASLSHVLVADLQSDNAPEIIGLDNNSNSLVVMLNLGDGTYGPPNYYGLKEQANGIAVGDFNGDGKLDVAVGLGSYNTPGSVAVLLNAGHGMLHKPVYYKLSIPADSIAVADLNNDNLPDIAVVGNTNNNGTNTVTILTNTGSSFTQKSFPAPVYFTPNGFGPDADFIDNLAAGDFDGDGRIDLAYIDACAQCDVSEEELVILANTPSGWKANMPTGGTGSTSLKAADIDGDGKTDLVIPYRGCHTPCVGVSVLFMGKNFSIARVQSLDVLNDQDGPTPTEVVVGDFNSDGLADIAGFSFGGADQNENSVPPGIMMWTASAPRTFNSLKYYNQPNPASEYNALYTAAGFLNKDGKRDLVVPLGNEVQVWSNTTSTAKDPCSYPTSGGVHVCAPTADVASGTVRFLASARTNTQPLLRFELWIDGHKKLQLFTDRMNVKLPVSDGTHEAVFVEVGASGLHIKKAIHFNVGNIP
jgi:hypothetical protein